MNCDHAFELITDPVGSGSPTLQRHLERCPRCRQMQQTLAPALDWLMAAEPALSPGSSSRGEAPFLSAQAVLVAEQVARSLPRRCDRGWGESLCRGAAIAAVAALGVLFGALLLEPKSPEKPATSAGTLTACLWEQQQLLDQLPDTSARGVVVSCVMCHVPRTVQ
uniref:Zinc-finger domain-containing protein n=1 Tax=Schlesneria paludicola TaxID=360056 RepID=A0A7C2P0D6_9PLAN